MEKITSSHPLSQSTDIVKDNLETLKRLFPTIVKEGRIDVDELKALLDEEIETNEEYYRFSWAGKSDARREANKPSTATLRPNQPDSKNWDTTGNVFIEGDNLEVLKLLQKSYSGRIKMIYIDPPYNTGKDFVYKDNYADNLGNYLALTGQTDEEGKKLSSNTESDGRYHSNWLNMMYPRLKLARNLMTEDGVIFISIDDNEVHNLRKLCDEIFERISTCAMQANWAACRFGFACSKQHASCIWQWEISLVKTNPTDPVFFQARPGCLDEQVHIVRSRLRRIRCISNVNLNPLFKQFLNFFPRTL
jgi:adenine-specific DNA-methyltransferase